jgi:hypothetical protein
MRNNVSIHDLPRLTSKYRGYIQDPEGNAIELLEMFFVRDAIQVLLGKTSNTKLIPPELHREIKELDDTLWHQRQDFVEIITPMLLQNARRKRKFPREAWWWYLDELAEPKAATSKPRKMPKAKMVA